MDQFGEWLEISQNSSISPFQWGNIGELGLSIRQIKFFRVHFLTNWDDWEGLTDTPRLYKSFIIFRDIYEDNGNYFEGESIKIYPERIPRIFNLSPLPGNGNRVLQCKQYFFSKNAIYNYPDGCYQLPLNLEGLLTP